MAKRNKKVTKLRRYRDKLLTTVTELEGTIRQQEKTFWEIRKALQREDLMRAYALASEPEEHLKDFMNINEAVKELTLVLRFLITERQFTEQIKRAVQHKDWLRTLALCAEHEFDQIDRDKAMGEWLLVHGITKSMRRTADEEDY